MIDILGVPLIERNLVELKRLRRGGGGRCEDRINWPGLLPREKREPRMAKACPRGVIRGRTHVCALARAYARTSGQ